MIGIINYGMGNLASVKNALDYLRIDSRFINSPQELNKVDKLILPGVGAFGMAMSNLISKGFAEPLKEEILLNKKPILGICLGMQLLLTKSCEFGEYEGLNLIKGEVKSFSDKITDLPIPHMGWNQVNYCKNLLLEDVSMQDAVFYFVHSFYCELHDKNQESGETKYGFKFTSMIEKENIFGAQFHPEKSQKYGLKIFSSFQKI